MKICKCGIAEVRDRAMSEGEWRLPERIERMTRAAEECGCRILLGGQRVEILEGDGVRCVECGAVYRPEAPPWLKP